jgi:matrix metalloproteinase-14 (membrane-inserted)
MTRPVSTSDWCTDSTFNAIFSVDSTLFAFKGSQFGLLDMNGIVAGYPRNLSMVWPGLPADIDAAMVWAAEGTTDPPGFIPLSVYFFKGDQCYLFTFQSGKGFVMNSGYPRTIITDFPGVPSDIDAAFVWSGNGKPYFFKGDKYYRFTRGSMVDAGFPRNIAAWKGLPKKVDAAFSNRGNSRTYFFSGQDFYRFHDTDFKVDAGYPKKTADVWLGCKLPGTEGNEMMKEMKEGGMQFDGVGGASTSGSEKLLSSSASILFSFLAIYVINVLKALC